MCSAKLTVCSMECRLSVENTNEIKKREYLLSLGISR